MNGFSIWHWLIVLLISAFYVLLIMVPCAKIARQAGYSCWWAITCVIPVMSLITLWAFALSKWPSREAIEYRSTK